MRFKPQPSCPTMLERALRALEGASDRGIVDDLHAWLSRHRSYSEGEIRVAMMPGQVRALAIKSWRGAQVLEQPLSRSHIVVLSRQRAIKRREHLAERLVSSKCRLRRQVAEVFTTLSVALDLEAGNVVGDMLIDLSRFALDLIERDFGVEFPAVEQSERRLTVAAPADEVWELLDQLDTGFDSNDGRERRSMMALRKRLRDAKEAVASGRR